MSEILSNEKNVKVIRDNTTLHFSTNNGYMYIGVSDPESSASIILPFDDMKEFLQEALKRVEAYGLSQ